MVFDGDCEFCRFWVRQGRKLTGDRVKYRPFQEVAEAYPGIPREAFEEAVQWIEGARVLSGADAVFRALEFGSGPVRWLGWGLGRFPGALPLGRRGYRFVARHRAGLSRVARCFANRSVRWGLLLGVASLGFAAIAWLKRRDQ